MAAPRHSIFISYRRRETAFAVDQLDHALKHAFGDDVVFRDVRSIRKGQAFPDDIRAALNCAHVGLVVVGPWWLTIGEDTKDPAAQRRLHDPEDWVRLEVEALLQRTHDGGPISVIPLYTAGAAPPKKEDLPECLQALADRDGMEFDPYPDTEHSIQKIITHVAGILGVTPQPAGAPSVAADPRPLRTGGNSFSVTGKEFVGRATELHLLDEAWGRSAGDKINIVSFIGQGGEGKSALVLEWEARRARSGWPGTRRVFEWSFYSQGSTAQSAASADEFFSAALPWFGHTGEMPKDSRAKGSRLAELIAAERTFLVLDGLEPLQHPPGSGYDGEFKDPAMTMLLTALAKNNPGLCVLTSRVNITALYGLEREGGPCLRHALHALDPAAARQLLRTLGVDGLDRELDQAIAWFHGHAYDLNLLGNYLGKCTDDHDIRGWEQRFPILREDEKIHPVPDAAGKRAGHGRRMLRAYERWLGADSPAAAILRLLGLFDRPARSDLLEELCADPVIPGLNDALMNLPHDEWLGALSQLEELSLITREKLSLPAGLVKVEPVAVSPDEVTDELLDGQLKNPNLPAHIRNLSRAELKRLLAQAIAQQKNQYVKNAERPRRSVSVAVDAHPLLREHFGAELREDSARWRAAHRRLYEYLCDTTPDKSAPTLEELQPLYQAVAHGCQAGLQQEAYEKVYFARIGRGNEAYAVQTLGAFGSDLGAVASFFDEPWIRPSPIFGDARKSLLLNRAAFRLRALGRLTEALEPMRVSGEMDVKVEEWKGAAISYSNLSELEQTLGELALAERDAAQSVTYADRTRDAFLKMATRTTHADALHQAGSRAEAEALFRKTEQMQAERQPEYPLLYALTGFRYCDLLLTESERAAWQVVTRNIELRSPPSGDNAPRYNELQSVFRRAAQTLKWVTEGKLGPFDIALDHLTLGRAALYEAMMKQADRRSPTSDLSHIDAAVTGLRRAGTQYMIPLCLLTRAWLRFITGARTGPGSAQEDLDEAWEIAERGPMKLHLADIHLYRARLYFREATYPWNKHPDGSPRGPKDDLAAAEELINACGYHRRDEELADAKAAIEKYSA